MRIASLDRSQLASAKSVLAASCAFDRADVVADEKLFGLGLKGAPIAIGAWMSSDELAAIAEAPTTSDAATSAARSFRAAPASISTGAAAIASPHDGHASAPAAQGRPQPRQNAGSTRRKALTGAPARAGKSGARRRS